MESFLSSASTSAKPAWPSIWRGGGPLPRRDGRRSFATMLRALPQWTFSSCRRSRSGCSMDCSSWDRDRAYGEIFVRRVRSIGIRDRPTSPRSPWQNGIAERLIGSIRRECIDHVVVFGERHLRHVLLSYKDYYNATRTHLSLNKDALVPRGVERVGNIVCRPILGGLHHQYGRM